MPYSYFHSLSVDGYVYRSDQFLLFFNETASSYVMLAVSS